MPSTLARRHGVGSIPSLSRAFERQVDSPAPAPRWRPWRWLGAAIVALLVGVVATVLGVGAVLPPLSVLPRPHETVDGRPDPPLPRVAGPVDLPAFDAVAELASKVPDGFGGTETTTSSDRVVPVPGGCPQETAMPVVSALRSWNDGGSAGNPSGFELHVGAYGAGVAGAVLDEMVSSGCARNVDASVDMVRIDQRGSSTAVVRVGDVLVSLRAIGHDVPQSAVDDVVGRIGPVLAPVCKETTSGRDVSRRNPYLDPDRFTGRLVDRTVLPRSPGPAVLHEADLPQLARVVIPARPDEPFWPAKLPDAVSRPERPVLPQPQQASRQIEVRVADDEGPGCGWDFTGMVVPSFDVDAAEAAEQSMTKAAQDGLEADQARYAREATAYLQAADRYREDAVRWNNYAVQVAEIARAWDKQRADQERYRREMAVFDRAVADRDAFVRRQEQARADYEAAVQVCASRPTVTATTTQTAQVTAPATPQPTAPAPTSQRPTPSASPTPTPTGHGFAPAQELVCPPQRPAILDQSPPQVPPRPTPPPDPRPEHER